MLSATHDRLLRLPKAELHVHLDGSLRPSTLLELTRVRGLQPPGTDAASVADHMLVRDASRLEDYLARFTATLAVMQEADSLERIAYELAADHAAEGVRWLEVRFCPLLCTEEGLASDAVLDAVLAGLARAEREHDVRASVIVCALRSLPASASREMAELAAAYRDRGVCAFDLAGAEAGFPVHEHAEACEVAAAAGLPSTIHAGEGYGPESIREAVEIGRARRIGHGTRLGEDPALLAQVREAGVCLEVCLTSNVQTRVARTYEAHPLRGYFDAGVRVALCTDNRLMSGVTLTREYEHARDSLGFDWDDLVAVARTGFDASFAPAPVRAELLARFDREAAAMSEGA